MDNKIIEQLPDQRRCELCGQTLQQQHSASCEQAKDRDNNERQALLMSEAARIAIDDPRAGWAMLVCCIGGLTTRQAAGIWGKCIRYSSHVAVARWLSRWKSRTSALYSANILQSASRKNARRD